MNVEDLRALAERATDVEGRQSGRLDEVHDRIRTARRRRAAVAGAGAAGLALAVVFGVSMLSGSDPRSEEPVVPPTPGPSETLDLPAGEVTYTADISPGDIRGWETAFTMTNTQDELLGATDLSATVPLTGSDSMQWVVSPFCQGGADTWYRLTYGDGGRRWSRCSPEDSLPVAPSFQLITPIPRDQQVEGSADVPMRIMVTKPTQAWVDCYTSGKSACTRTVPQPRPLASTDVEFGFVVHEHPAAPTVLEVLGQPFEALAKTFDGEEYLVEKAVLAAADASTLVVPVDGNGKDRVVGIYQIETSSWDECRERHDTEGILDDPELPRSAYEKLNRACTAELEVRVDGEPVALDNTSHGLYGVTGSAIPAGAREISVEVVKNDPRNIRYAVVLWQARS